MYYYRFGQQITILDTFTSYSFKANQPVNGKLANQGERWHEPKSLHLHFATSLTGGKKGRVEIFRFVSERYLFWQQPFLFYRFPPQNCATL